MCRLHRRCSMEPSHLMLAIRFCLTFPMRTSSTQQEGAMKAGPLATERQAFCATCPSAEEVSTLLATLGFSLDFQLDAQYTSQLPLLPAQYHYQDVCGTEVIYLAGRDVALDGEQFPPHASRFWLYAG